MFIVLQVPGDFDIFTFHSLWQNDGCKQEQAAAIKQALKKDVLGEDYIVKAAALLRSSGFKEVTRCMTINIASD